MPGEDKQPDLLRLPPKDVLINAIFPFLRGKEISAMSRLSTHWNKEIKPLMSNRKFWLKVLERDFGYKEDPNPQYQYNTLELKKMYSYIATLEQNNPSHMKWLRQNILETGIHYPPLHAKDITQDEWDNHIELMSFYWEDVIACGNKEFHANKIGEDLTEWQKQKKSNLDYVGLIIELGNKKLIQEELKAHVDDNQMHFMSASHASMIFEKLIVNNKIELDFLDLIFHHEYDNQKKAKQMLALQSITMSISNMRPNEKLATFIKEILPRFVKDAIGDLPGQGLGEMASCMVAIGIASVFHDDGLIREAFELAENERKFVEAKLENKTSTNEKFIMSSAIDLNPRIALIKDSETIKWLMPKYLSILQSKDQPSVYIELCTDLLIEAAKQGNVELVNYILNSDMPLGMSPQDKKKLFEAALLEPKLLTHAKSLLDPEGGNLSYFIEKKLTEDQNILISNVTRVGNLSALKWLIDDKKIPVSSENMQNYFFIALINGQFHIADWLQNEKKIVFPKLPLDTMFPAYIANAKNIGKDDHILALIHWLTCGKGDNQHVDPLELKPMMLRLYDEYDKAVLFFVAESLDQLKFRTLKPENSIEHKM